MRDRWGNVTGRMKLTIRMKLLAGFLVVGALLAFVSMFALSQIQDMSKSAEEIDQSRMPSVSLLGMMNGDISDIERLALGIIVETDTNEIAKMNESLQQLEVKIEGERKQLISLLEGNTEALALYDTFSTNYDAYLAKKPAFIERGMANDFSGASKLHAESYPLWFTANDNISQLITLVNELSKQATTDSLVSAERAFNIILAVTVISLLLAVFIAFFIAGIISRPIQKLNTSAMLIANGDLTGETITLKNKDELGTLAASFNTMTGNLRAMIQSVSTTSEQVAASSEELLASAEQNTKASEQISETVELLAAGTTEQVNIVKRSSQAMNEMSLGSEQIAQLAQSVSVSAVDAANQSAEGNRIVRQAVEQMGSIRTSIASLTELVTGLGERSAEIGSITGVINNIARQTNLLALNAAIEAARAGEHGRGFAVVAGEVRKLAEESSLSAQKITDLVQLIQSDTDQAVEAVQVNSSETEAGIEMVTAAGQAFEQISEVVNKVAGEIQEVSAGSEEMTASTDESVRYMSEISMIAEESSSGVHNVSAATEEQLASMEEISTSAGALSKMAEELQEQINKFKV
ncbi:MULTISPECIES: methyl-accepting chemotaxis protein [unclassified Paenibacillus]|uniref:methyl-accepting chemotaxis protein n=1 Tax=unclassified Paenibacillus TaxID=185978 RepID=UPI002406D093|nr:MULTISPECIES: methyl-accepting chemotaxis protein [unclassified Paenibacillus]MDF9842853.1 methyl-accepting chemotaxis protein [Paenibacillus sp. PastF-2]MDF9849279.1 methyl-accepting chemotaxis protein [Paenibacillus sp. PastM-2]MDF9856013.1 methyl-accepting chemotaxis protein [Paenibacillus sp. PastF-1]MDH6481120.1 methyl-accepting chemotaxis protein [Paenibacillus sp. PastH-2]MDH6508541.1 methyl-accepting chemotaxis protein [Paenibacillus sp. PastM-3]